MSFQVESGTALAQAIQNAVQPKLMENGWVAEGSDTALSEYVTMMIINGKTQEQVISELGTELLGVGEDDPAVAELASWLFQQIPTMKAQLNGQPAAEGGDAPAQQQDEQTGASQDASMDDAAATGEMYVTALPTEHACHGETSWQLPVCPSLLTLNVRSPSGPKAMRAGAAPASGRGRDKRIIGQVNRQMDRSQEDRLRRIKAPSGGQSGRINSHAGRELPRGPRGGSLASGLQRAMNGRPGQPGGPMITGAQQGGAPGISSQQQMQFLQMMEMQSQMMAQMLNGQAPNMGGAFNPSFQNQQHQTGKSLFERVNKRPNRGGARQHIHNAHASAENGSGMDVDQPDGEDGSSKRKDPFDTICHFNNKCTVATCPYAHQSPAAPAGTTIDLTDRCSFGAACENRKCTGKHPSPAQRRQHLKDDVDCKFYPNCTNPACPFRHPDMPACRNGADCTTPGCKFSHSKILCRYNPCLNPTCMYKHADGQRRGKFEDKVWTAEGTSEDGFDRAAAERSDKADRFKGLGEQTEQGEELILPGRGSPDASEVQQQEDPIAT